jgi:hypothetical protein
MPNQPFFQAAALYRSRLCQARRRLTVLRHAWLGWLIVCAAALPGTAQSAPATACSAEEARDGNRNQSVLTVSLSVSQGKLAVDHQASAGQFKPSQLFQCRAGMAAASAAKAAQIKRKFEQQLLLELDAKLAQLQPLALFALKVNESADPATQTPQFNALQTSRAWADYRKLYLQWQETFPPEQRNERDLVITFNRLLVSDPGNLNSSLGDTPLRKFDQSFDEDALNDALDVAAGQVSFHIADPIGDWRQARDYRVTVPAPVSGVAGAAFIAPTQAEIIKALTPLKGTFWRRKTIEAYLNDFFAQSRSGYLPTFCVSEAAPPPPPAFTKRVIINAIPQIARFVFYGIAEEPQITLALRQLLTDKEFAIFLKKLPALQALRSLAGSKDDDLVTFLKKLEDLKNRPDSEKPSGLKELLEKSPPIIKLCPAKTAEPNTAGDGQDQPLTISCLAVSYEDLGDKDHLPFVNAANLDFQRTLLAARGFNIGPGPFVPEEEMEETDEQEDDDAEAQCGNLSTRLIELQLSRRDDEAAVKNAKDANQPAAATPAGTPATASTELPAGATGATGTANAGAAGQAATPPELVKLEREARCINKPCLNFLGGLLAYRPGQGMRFYGLYRRLDLANGNWSVRGGYHGGLIVEGDGSWDYLLFSKLHRRLSFQVDGQTDSQANRLFNGVQTNQHNTGGAFRGELELLSDPRLFSVFFAGKHDTIELTQGDKVVGKQNLTTLQTGATFVTASRGVRFRRVLQLEPALNYGPEITPGQQAFTVFALSGLFHQYLPGRRDLVVSGRVEAASRQTPFFVQPYLGGEDSVRGFRVDDAIGRRHWVLQHEYLFPVPGLKPDSAGLLAMLRTQMQVATFFDVGGIYRTYGSLPGVRYGSGAGIRFKYGPHLLKLDWAYGFGHGALGRGHGRVYFSISREIPRLIRQ